MGVSRKRVEYGIHIYVCKCVRVYLGSGLSMEYLYTSASVYGCRYGCTLCE